jgi:hypothetical protein
VHHLYGLTRRDAYRKGAIHGAAVALAVFMFIALCVRAGGASLWNS